MPDDELVAQGRFLRRLAYALLQDEHAAEDVVQSAYLAALETRPVGAGWMRAVVRNLARKRLRANRRRDARERTVARREAEPSTAEAAAQMERQARVVAAVRALDEPYRRAIVLRYYYGRTPTGIAAQLGVPVATVKTRLRRALAKLRVSLDEDSGGRSRWAPSLAGLLLPARSATALATGSVVMGKKVKLGMVLLVLLVAGFGISHVHLSPTEAVDAGRRAAHTGAGTRAGTTAEVLDTAGEAAAAGPALTVTVVDADEHPVAGAAVSLFRRPEQPAEPGLSLPLRVADPSQPWGRRKTGADGSVRFTDVPREWLRIVATHTEYAPAHGAVSLRMHDAETRTLVLRPGHTLEGRIRTRRGRPVAGALVYAGPPGLPRGRGVTLAGVRTTTDGQGRYRLEGMRRGDRAVLAAWPGGLPRYVTTVRIPGVDRFDITLPEAGVVTGVVRVEGTGKPLAGATVVAKGSVRGVTVGARAITDRQGAYRIDTLAADRLYAVTAHKDGYLVVPDGATGPHRLPAEHDVTMRRATILHGVVRGPDGPVPDAHVGAYQTDDDGRLRAFGDRAGRGGRYRLTLPPGRTYVRVFARGYQVAGQPAVNVTPTAVLKGATGDEPWILDAPGPGEHRHDIAVVPGDGAIEGLVVDALNRPLEGAVVSSSGAEARSGEDGRFRIEGVLREKGLPAPLFASKEGYRSHQSWDRKWPADGRLRDVVVKLEPLPRVRCRVHADGAPVPGAFVLRAATRTSVHPAGSDDSWMQRRDRASLWHRASRVETDEVGECEITLRGGSVHVRAGAPGYAPSGAVVVGSAHDDVLEFDLVAARTVRGRLVREGSGEPVAGARVSYGERAPNGWGERLYGPSETVAATTGEDGAFELTGLARREYIVWAEAPGVTVGRVHLPPHADELVIDVKPLRTVAGTVVHANGRPAPGVQVFVKRALPRDPPAPREDRAFRFPYRLVPAITDGEGRFSYGLAYDGEYDVEVDTRWTRRNGFAEARVERVAAGTRDIRLVLRRGETISGRVVDPAGQGVADVKVSASRRERGGGVSGSHATSGDDGRFVIRGLAAGFYRVSVPRSARRGFLSQEFGRVEAGASGVRVEVIAVTGVLVDASGTPLAHHPIRIQRKGMPHPKRLVLDKETDAEGRFVFRALLPGRYRLSHPPPRPHGGATLLFRGGADVGAGTHEIIAVPGLSIAGRVVGAKTTRSYVSALTADREHRLLVPVRNDGSFEITGLARDEIVRLSAWGEGHGVVTRQDVRAGTTGLELRVPR